MAAIAMLLQLPRRLPFNAVFPWTPGLQLQLPLLALMIQAHRIKWTWRAAILRTS